MAESESLASVAALVNAVLMPFPKGLTLPSFLKEYQNLVGHPLPYQKLGFDSAEELLSAIPENTKVMNVCNNILVQAVATKSNAHISHFVKRQQKGKKSTKRDMQVVKRTIHTTLSLPQTGNENLFTSKDINDSSRSPVVMQSPSDKLPESIKENITQLVARSQQGIPLTQFLAQYRSTYNEDLNVWRWGYNTCKELLEAMNGTSLQLDNDESEIVLRLNERYNGTLNDGGLTTGQSPVAQDFLEIPFENLGDQLGDQNYIFVEIAEIYNPQDFWWIPYNRKAEVEKLSDDMKNFYEDAEAGNFCFQTYELQQGQLIAVKYSADQLWYRAKIQSFSFNLTAVVRFIDYGTLDTVSIIQMRRLDKQFMQLPRQGRRGRLACVKPLTDDKWSTESSVYFRDLIFNKPLAAYFVERSPLLDDGEDFIHNLILVDTSDSDTFISERMIDNNFAQPLEEEETAIDPPVAECNHSPKENSPPENVEERYTSRMSTQSAEITNFYSISTPPPPLGTRPPHLATPPILVQQDVSLNQSCMLQLNSQDLLASSCSIPSSQTRPQSGATPTFSNQRQTYANPLPGWSGLTYSGMQPPLQNKNTPFVSIEERNYVNAPPAVSQLVDSVGQTRPQAVAAPQTSANHWFLYRGPPLQYGSASRSDLNVREHQSIPLHYQVPPPLSGLYLGGPAPLKMAQTGTITSVMEKTKFAGREALNEMTMIPNNKTPLPTVTFPDLLIHSNSMDLYCNPLSRNGSSSLSESLSRCERSPCPSELSLRSTVGSFLQSGLITPINLSNGVKVHLFLINGARYIASQEIFFNCGKFSSISNMELTLRLRRFASPLTCKENDQPSLFLEMIQNQIPWAKTSLGMWTQEIKLYPVDYALAVWKVFGCTNPSTITTIQENRESLRQVLP